MSNSYAFLASIFFFVFMMRAASNYRLGIPFPATSVVILPFLFSKFLLYIYLVGTHRPLSGLFAWQDIIPLVLQLAVSFFVFYKLEQNEESVVSWMLWGGAGGAVIFYVIPALV